MGRAVQLQSAVVDVGGSGVGVDQTESRGAGASLREGTAAADDPAAEVGGLGEPIATVDGQVCVVGQGDTDRARERTREATIAQLESAAVDSGSAGVAVSVAEDPLACAVLGEGGGTSRCVIHPLSCQNVISRVRPCKNEVFGSACSSIAEAGSVGVIDSTVTRGTRGDCAGRKGGCRDRAAHGLAIGTSVVQCGAAGGLQEADGVTPRRGIG